MQSNDGTAEKLGGGKFANGAVTGAYVMMFNHLQYEWHPCWRGFVIRAIPAKIHFLMPQLPQDCIRRKQNTTRLIF